MAKSGNVSLLQLHAWDVWFHPSSNCLWTGYRQTPTILTAILLAFDPIDSESDNGLLRSDLALLDILFGSDTEFDYDKLVNEGVLRPFPHALPVAMQSPNIREWRFCY